MLSDVIIDRIYKIIIFQLFVAGVRVGFYIYFCMTLYTLTFLNLLISFSLVGFILNSLGFSR